MVKPTPRGLLEWYHTPLGRKMTRYTLVSVVAVPIGLAFDILALDVFHWSPGPSGVWGAAWGALPSYYLNRYWAWGKTGRNHLFKEIIPFWVLAVIGVAFAGWTQSMAGHFTDHHHIGGLSRQVIILGAYLAGFGILWLFKYVILDLFLFTVDEPETLERTGV